MKNKPSYRPELRGFVFALVALGLRGVAFALLVQTMMSKNPDQMTVISVGVFNLAAMCTALAAVGYSAIAAHRGRWGLILVLAWLFSVLAVFGESQPFAYATF
jgi:hypothetical protein